MERAGKQGLVGIGIGKGKRPTRHREQHIERHRCTKGYNFVDFSKNMGYCGERERERQGHTQEMSESLRKWRAS